jgi:hypothetical protein
MWIGCLVTDLIDMLLLDLRPLMLLLRDLLQRLWLMLRKPVRIVLLTVLGMLMLMKCLHIILRILSTVQMGKRLHELLAYMRMRVLVQGSS